MSEKLIWKLYDLIRLSINPFPNQSFYNSFMTDIGSVIKQRLSVRVSLNYYESKSKPYHIIVGYKIEKLQDEKTSSDAVSQNGEIEDSGSVTAERNYINRPNMAKNLKKPKRIRIAPNSWEETLSPQIPPKIFKKPLVSRGFVF